MIHETTNTYILMNLRETYVILELYCFMHVGKKKKTTLWPSTHSVFTFYDGSKTVVKSRAIPARVYGPFAVKGSISKHTLHYRSCRR